MNAQLPTNVDIAHARLPATYEQAKIALASCERLDECQEWANKAEALASYAKMADDDSLRMLADRIQSRAVNRMGVLLKTFNAQGQRADILPDGAVRKLTQTEAARAAGISERQQVTAVRVSNIPTEQFEALIESDNPPTVTALAEMGKQSRSVPEGFKQATHLIGSVLVVLPTAINRAGARLQRVRLDLEHGAVETRERGNKGDFLALRRGEPDDGLLLLRRVGDVRYLRDFEGFVSLRHRLVIIVRHLMAPHRSMQHPPPPQEPRTGRAVVHPDHWKNSTYCTTARPRPARQPSQKRSFPIIGRSPPVSAAREPSGSDSMHRRGWPRRANLLRQYARA